MRMPITRPPHPSASGPRSMSTTPSRPLLTSLALMSVFLGSWADPAHAAPVCAAPVPGAAVEKVRGFSTVGGGWLVDARNGAFYVNDRGSMVSRIDGPALGPIDRVLEINSDLSILIKNRDGSGAGGVYLLDAKSQKIQEMAGSEPLQVFLHGRLASGGFLLGADRGLYRIEAGNHQLRELPKPVTGAVSVLQALDDGNWLAGAYYGLFRVDSRGGRTDAVPGSDTGTVSAIRRLNDGAWLIGAERGLFRVDAGGRTLTALPARRGNRVLEIHKLVDNSFIVRLDGGLVAVDPDGKKIETLSEEPAFSWRIFASNDKGALLGSEKLLYIYLTGTKRLEQLSGEAGSDIYSSHEIPEGWLVSTRRGLYKIELPKTRVSAVKGPVLGTISDMQALKSGDWLLRAKNGVFRADAGLKSVDHVEGATLGEVHAFKPLKDGGALVGAERGLFRIAAETPSASPVEGAGFTEVTGLHPLANGEWLAVGQGGVARVDAQGRVGAPVAVPSSAAGLAVQPLPQGGVLFGTSKGVLNASATLSDAKVQIASAGLSGAMIWSLRHPCASAAENLGLVVEARPASALEAQPRELRVGGFEPNGDDLRFIADPSSLTPGNWSLRLVSKKADEAAAMIGAPIAFTYRETGWDWVRRHQFWLIGAIVGFGVFALAGLLFAARWRSGALRVLRHPVWSKIAFGPSLLLRGSSAARLWVLAPWFAATRAATPAERPFYDMPVTGPEGAESTAMGLLARAGERRRIWLRGALGMGKTEMLTMWRRAFFASHRTLEDAVKAYGFLPALISARVFADIPADPRKPEAAVVEALHRSFREVNFPIDRTFLRILLRKGNLMVAIDDATEADRDGPIAAFVRAYPDARLAVASRAMAPDGFDLWHLPAQVGPHIESLLSLWLGAYSGSRLAARAAREGLAADLVSILDVRLLADLVTVDPNRPIPGTRSGLFQAALERAESPDGTVLRLDLLKATAWTMTLEGRRTLQSTEVESLGAPTVEALTAARVLRAEGPTVSYEHDLIRLYLAALWLTETRADQRAIIRELETSGVWRCSADDQIELWRFMAQLITPEGLAELWPFALESIDRVYLQSALYARARASNLFPLGLSIVGSGPSARRRVGSTILSAAGA
jgi:ligand-binding sensor domain-containing protein